MRRCSRDIDQLVDRERRARFLELRGLGTWNSGGVPWRERGFEHAAEIVAWGLGEGVLSPSIPDNDDRSIESAFVFLTGVEPLA